MVKVKPIGDFTAFNLVNNAVDVLDDISPVIQRKPSRAITGKFVVRARPKPTSCVRLGMHVHINSVFIFLQRISHFVTAGNGLKIDGCGEQKSLRLTFSR